MSFVLNSKRLLQRKKKAEVAKSFLYVTQIVKIRSLTSNNIQCPNERPLIVDKDPNL